MKTKWIIVLLAALLITSAVQSRDLAARDARAEIIALDDAWIKAEVGHDRAALEEILDERFLITYPSGRTADREMFISGILKSDLKPFKVIHEEIRIHGKTAVVIDSTTDKKIRFIWIAVKKGKKWRVVSEVAIRVAEPK